MKFQIKLKYAILFIEKIKENFMNVNYDIEINYKKFSNLYDNQDSSNYNLKKNIFFYLKKITFFIFFLKLENI